MEEWNEFGELHQNIGEVPTTSTSVTSTPAKPGFGSPAGSAAGTPSKLGIGTPQSNASSPAVERETAERQKETASIGSIRNNPFMKQLATDAASKAKTRTFGGPKPTPKEPLQDTTNTASQPAAPVTSQPAAIPASPVASPSAEIASAAITSPSSPRSPSRHSSHSSRHSSFVPEHPSPAVTQHRGSEVSLASQDEIKEIEKATMIPEEDEGDDSAPCIPAKAPTSAKASSSATAEPAPPRAEDLADLQALLTRVGTDLSAAEDAAGVSSPVVTTRSLEAEDHAATPAAAAPIETFEARLSRTGTDLAALQLAHRVTSGDVLAAELEREDHADTPAASSPIDAFEAALSRVGTGLGDLQRAQGLSAVDVLEAQLEREDHADTPAATSPIENFEAKLNRVGTELSEMEREHGLSAEDVAEEAMGLETHIPLQTDAVPAPAAVEKPGETEKPAPAGVKPAPAAEKPAPATEAEHAAVDEVVKKLDAVDIKDHPARKGDVEVDKTKEAAQA